MSFADTIGNWVDKSGEILSDFEEAASSISDLGADLGLWDQDAAQDFLGGVKQNVKDVENAVQRKKMESFFNQYGVMIAGGIIGLIVITTFVRK